MQDKLVKNNEKKIDKKIIFADIGLAIMSIILIFIAK